MTRQTVIQNSFTRGELSPRMRGRVDLEQYYQGGQTVLNFVPLSHGGVTNRPGTVYVAEVKTSASATRLIPFVFNVSDAYALEFGATYMRVFRNQGTVVSADTDAAITNGTFDSGISGWTDKSTGTAAIAYDVNALQLQGNGADIAIAEQEVSISASFQSIDHVIKFKVIGASTSGTIKLRIGSTSGATDIVNDVSFKDGYHCYGFDPGANSSFFVQFRNTENANHDIDNISIIDNAAIEIETPYAAADLFQIQYVQNYNTMWLVHPSYKPLQLARSDHDSWSLTSYTPTTDPFTSANNYPAAVAKFQGRIIFGYTATNPQRIFCSVSGDLEDMTTGTGASDGFTKDLESAKADPVRWVVGGADLIIGTAGAEWIVQRATDSPMTVTNFDARPRETSGCAGLSPAQIDNRVLFMARLGQASNDGEELREFKYSDTDGDFVAPDMTLLSEHVTDGGIVEMAWQQASWKGSYQSTDLPAVKRILWMVRSDGVLVAFTYNFHELVAAWSRHTTSPGSFESVCIVPGSSGDEVWVIVNRTINGSTVRYVEYMDPDYFVDSGLAGTSGTAKTAWSGLDHLEGESVTILADGAPVASKTVSSGAITLDKAASTVQIGKGYTPTVTLMPLEFRLPEGSSIGAGKTISRVVARLLTTVGITVTASNRVTADEVQFRQVSDSVLTPIPPFTGDKEFTPPSSWIDAEVTINQPNPLPATVQMIAMEAEGHR